MNTLLKKIKFNQFENFPELIHGISPRYFKNDQEGIEEFNFRDCDGSGKTKDHSKIFLESLGIANRRPVVVDQVHSDKVFILENADRTHNEIVQVQADALLTNLVGKAIGVFTADCLPILIYDPRLKVIGAIHAGRKGSEQNILFKVVREMVSVYGSCPEELMVGFGPAIGGCCYEVGEDCLQPFQTQFKDAKDWFRPGSSGKYYLDLLAINKMDAERAGLMQGNMFSLDHCTCCSSPQMFSYRREGKTGRILTTIMLRP